MSNVTTESPSAVTGGTPGVARYRLRSRSFDAIQWTRAPGNLAVLEAFAGAANVKVESGRPQVCLTRSGWCPLWRGDWVGRAGDELFLYAEKAFARDCEPADTAPPLAAALDRARVAALISKRTGLYGMAAEDLAGAIIKLAQDISDEKGPDHGRV